MSKLINKLNVLVRSSVNNVLSGDGTRRPTSKRRRQPASKKGLDQNIDREIVTLRETITQALNDEDRLEADIVSLQRQIADWDQQADAALKRGEEATARHAVHQMQLCQQQMTMIQSDLVQHRRSTSELIHRVNELEALVAEARQQPSQDEADQDTVSLSERLREVRQQANQQTAPAAPASPPAEIDTRAIDDDLAARRARLSQ